MSATAESQSSTALALPFQRTASRVSTYPVVASSIAYYHDSSLGHLTNSVYATVTPLIAKVAGPPYRAIVPVIEPLAKRPYQTAVAVADKADVLVAEHGLPTLEAYVPLVKSEPQEVKEATASLLSWPSRAVSSARTRLWDAVAHADEQVRSKALVIEDWAVSWLKAVREKADAAASSAKQDAQDVSKTVREKANEANIRLARSPASSSSSE